MIEINLMYSIKIVVTSETAQWEQCSIAILVQALLHISGNLTSISESTLHSIARNEEDSFVAHCLTILN